MISRKHSQYLFNFAFALGAALITLAAGTVYFNLRIEPIIYPLLLLFIGSLVVVLFLSRFPGASRNLLAGLLVLMALCGLANQYWHFVPLSDFGDGKALLKMIESGAVFPRWLGGTYLIRFFYKDLGIDSFTDARSVLLTLNTLLMLGAGLLCIYRCSYPTAALLLVTSPLWILFSLGHIEYYPLVTPFLAIIFILASRDDFFKRAPSWTIAGAAALGVWLYIGYLPLALALLAAGIITRPKAGLVAITLAALIWCVLVTLSWEGGVNGYLLALNEQVSSGKDTLIRRYQRIVPADASVFFPLEVVFHPIHLKGLLVMIFYGAGLFTIPVLLVLAIWGSRRLGFSLSAIRQPQLVFGVTACASYLLYLLFMIPRLGPRADLDLFFVSYFTVAFFAGVLLDKFVPHTVQGVTISALIGNTVTLATALLFGGLPLPSQ